MTRKPRIVVPDQLLHSHCRGRNDRQAVYITPMQEFQGYVDEYYESFQQHGCQIHTYVLMTNHVHLLMTPLNIYGVLNMMQALEAKNSCRLQVNQLHINEPAPSCEGRFK